MRAEEPVRHILRTFETHRVRCLLMGGQACILYGAAEFSKDIDFALLADEENLACLNKALTDLDAEVIAVPPFEEKWLEAGLAVHFRCKTPLAEGFRIDLMTRMRGVDDFVQLWDRRNIVDLSPDLAVSVMALPDLVASKKTQRDKDWPMLKRLVEVDYFSHQEHPAPWQIDFWLIELRDPELLLEAAAMYTEALGRLTSVRPLLTCARAGESARLKQALEDEERAERQADEAYWVPLRKLLEDLRRNR